MKKTKLFAIAITGLLLTTFLNSCKQNNEQEIQKLKTELNGMLKSNETVEANLVKFDTLDFTVGPQQFLRMHESHSKDVKVIMPDGRIINGLEDHIKDLRWLFTFAPDLKILEHPVRFGSGDYTAVTGIMEGTFTKPMPMPDGSSIPPTGKSLKLTMVTIGKWKDGVMIEEQVFWDNLSFMKQLGLAK